MKEILVGNHENRSERDERLLRVAGYAQALADCIGLGDLRDKVAELHDHKGNMQVTWFNKPSPVEMYVLNQAWRSPVGDGSENVEHYFEGERIN